MADPSPTRNLVPWTSAIPRAALGYRTAPTNPRPAPYGKSSFQNDFVACLELLEVPGPEKDLPADLEERDPSLTPPSPDRVDRDVVTGRHFLLGDQRGPIALRVGSLCCILASHLLPSNSGSIPVHCVASSDLLELRNLRSGPRSCTAREGLYVCS